MTRLLFYEGKVARHSESADEESHGLMLTATFAQLSRDASPFHSGQAQHDIFKSFRVR